MNQKPIMPDESIETVKLNDQQTIRVHPKSQCVGQYCTIHNPSDHHMKDWPQFWRWDRGIMERICEHSIGHIDPDEINDTIGGVHGCDGCCLPD